MSTYPLTKRGIRLASFLVVGCVTLPGLALIGSDKKQTPPAKESSPNNAKKERKQKQVVPNAKEHKMSNGPTILKAVFAKSLKPGQDPAQMAPVEGGKAKFDQQDKAIFISLELANLPKEGALLFEVVHKNEPQQRSALVDFSSVSEELRKRSSVFLGAQWEPNVRMIGDQYAFHFYYQAKQDQPPVLIGTYPFKIAAPADAIPSRIASVKLASGETEAHDPLPAPAKFAKNQAVYLVFQGDLGKGSYLGLQWDRGGKGMSNSYPLTQNQKGQKFSLFFMPDGGWKTGPHQVTVFMDGEEVSRLSFQVE